MEFIQLKEVVAYRKYFIEIDNNKVYKRCRVQLHRRGVKLRDEVLGKKIKTKKQRLCKKNDFIVAEMDAKFGGYGIIPSELDGAIVSSHYYLYEVNSEKLNFEFLDAIIDSGMLQEQIKAVGSTNYSRISAKEVLEYKIPCPSLEKQKQIVSLCSATKANLINLKAELTHQQVLLKKLRQQILQEAIEGKLTTDWRTKNPDAEPASELLARIQAEKAQLIKDQKLKKGNLTSKPVTKRDIIIPESWIWCKNDEIFFTTKLAGFEYTKHIVLKDTGEVPVIRAQNVRPFKIKKDNLKFIDFKTSIKLERCALTKPCLLVTFIGAGIGDTAFFNEINRWHLAPNVAKIELFNGCENELDLEYLNIFLQSGSGRWEIFKHVKATAQPSLSMGTIRDIDFPIPPLAEQKAIVAKVEKLLAVCDQLETQITNDQTHAKQLMQAVLKEAFQPT